MRELRGISRKELAKQTEISFRSIQDYEQGHKDLSSAKADTLLRMARALNCSMEDLISEEDLSDLKPSELDNWMEQRNRRPAAKMRNTQAPAPQILFTLNPSDEIPYLLMH